MGKYRDHREPRRHRQGDDFSPFSERISEPSYFQQVRATAIEPVDAEVTWFNASKGFGFIKLPDGTEAYLHVRALEAAGSRNVSDGTRLKVTIEKSPKGPQVAQVLEISHQIKRNPAQPHGEAAAPTVAQPQGEGTVKWYNPEKGFGFIAPDNGEQDVFVHATTLSRSGLSVLVEGQKVFIECGPGKKGLEVRSIRLA
ncbi:cold-shock protein [Mesorhizobium sp. NPDC059054]|uniref:cold-shock protein n=1 Tax=Mesorhizobium sp. NPDC059054 TaxID=3346711 RepID=UPI0036A18FBE